MSLPNAVEPMKYKAILSTIYAGGLRISEACKLRVKDIDSKNMQIFVKCSKGNKDRYTILSKTNLEILREYWKTCRKPKELLFPGEKDGYPITTASVRAAMKVAKEKAGISKDLTVHSHATIMLLNGTHPKIVAERLGHADIRVTLNTYSHVLPGMQQLAVEELNKGMTKGGN